MPTANYVKLNTDWECSIQGNPSQAGARGVVRDQEGNWIIGFSIPLGNTTNNSVELWAIQHGLTMAWNLGYGNVIQSRIKL